MCRLWGPNNVLGGTAAPIIAVSMIVPTGVQNVSVQVSTSDLTGGSGFSDLLPALIRCKIILI